jgi:GT2 family glycosyltransferase
LTSRRVTAVILCWNRWELTRRCLGTLKSTTDLADVDVLVVDNGSTDETPERLRKYGWIRTLRLETNLGFVRGNNAGIAASDPASDVLLLNNDLEFPQPGWLDAIRATAASAPDIGIVGCRLRLPNGLLLHAGTSILPDTFWCQHIGALERDVNQYARDRDSQGVTFACAYIRRELLSAIGPLSTAFTTYFEDTDFCLRAAAAGFRTVCCGSATLVHHEHGSTGDAHDLFDTLLREGRRAFRKRWKKALEARYTHTVCWRSILNFPTGYAMSSRQILRALDAEGVRATYRYIYGPGTPWPAREDDNAHDDLLNVVMRRRAPWRPRVSVAYAVGDVFHKNRGRARVGYTMTEVDGFSPEWVRQANAMDEVWVPSAFNREAFLRSGLKRPIHVVPLGVDTDHFHPAIESHPNPQGDFVFLASFEWVERKRPEMILKVFNQTFRRTEPVLLVCKIININAAVNVEAQIAVLGLKERGGRIAFLHNKDLPYHELGSLYRSADCYVSAARGEGWNMPLMESMACGLPAIATDWGAHREYVHEGIAYPLRIRGTIPADSRIPHFRGLPWSDPDPDHLAHLFRYIFEHRDEAKAKGLAAAAEMHAKWTWSHAARRIKERLRTF